MRTGRLKPQTFAGILGLQCEITKANESTPGYCISSVTSDLGNSFDPSICPLPDDIFVPRLFKQYIPSSIDNPLYQNDASKFLGEDWMAGNLPGTNFDAAIQGSESDCENYNEAIPRPEQQQLDEQGDGMDSASRSSRHGNVLQRVPSSNNNSIRQSDERSTTSSATLTQTNSTPTKFPLINDSTDPDKWEDEFAHIDADWCMRTMDKLWNASFYEYVRDERNCECTAQHLSTIVKDYKLRQVSHALRWVVQGWRIEAVSKLLRQIFNDWLPDLAGYVFSQMTKGWPLKPQITLCTALLLANEAPGITAVFVRGLTVKWGRDTTKALIEYLDNVLEWNPLFFQEFTSTFVNCLKEDFSNNVPCSYDVNKFLDDLRDMVQSSIVLKSKKNHSISVADYNLIVVSHYLNCPDCLAGIACQKLVQIPVPGYENSNSSPNSNSPTSADASKSKSCIQNGGQPTAMINSNIDRDRRLISRFNQEAGFSDLYNASSSNNSTTSVFDQMDNISNPNQIRDRAIALATSMLNAYSICNRQDSDYSLQSENSFSGVYQNENFVTPEEGPVDESWTNPEGAIESELEKDEVSHLKTPVNPSSPNAKSKPPLITKTESTLSVDKAQEKQSLCIVSGTQDNGERKRNLQSMETVTKDVELDQLLEATSPESPDNAGSSTGSIRANEIASPKRLSTESSNLVNRASTPEWITERRNSQLTSWDFTDNLDILAQMPSTSSLFDAE